MQEDHRVERAQRAVPRPVPERARIHGSDAGMEPPPDAVFRDGWYEYVSADQPDRPLRLTRSRYTADFDGCARGKPCEPLSRVLPADGDVTLLWACEQPPGAHGNHR